MNCRPMASAELTIRNFEEDRVIWQYKRYLTRPILSEVDGPFGAEG